MKKKKWINCFLVMLLLCTIIFAGTPLSASAVSEEPQKVREVTELRTEYAKTFEMDDGQYLCEVHATPIHYKDGQDEFQDINNSIQEVKGKDGYTYSNTANSWYAYFADSIAGEGAVLLEKDDCSVSINLVDSGIKSSIQKSDVLDTSRSEIDEQLGNDDRAVVYKDVYKNVDIAYTVMSSGLKEDIILRDKNVPETYVFDIGLEGLDLIDENGSVYFTNSSGDNIFKMNTLFMEDANEKSSYNVGYKIEKRDTGYRMTITIDTEFLNEKDTKFPVIVDPTVTIYGTADTYDSYVCSAHPTYNYNYGSPDPISTAYTKLRTGKDSPYGVRRTYIRFNKPSLPSYAQVSSAYIKLYLLDSAGAINITAYRVQTSWNSSTITWNNMTSFDNNNSSGLAVNIGSGWYRMDVQYWFDRFYNGLADDYGFCIKDSNESSTSVWATFASSDYSGSSYDPVLYFTYSIPPVRLFYYNSGIPTVIPDIDGWFESHGFTQYSYYCTSADSVRSYIGQSRIVHIEGHGIGGGGIHCTETTSLTATGGTSNYYPLSGSYVGNGLPDCKFIFFSGCRTALYDSTYGDLDDYAYLTCGVDSTLAFNDPVTFWEGYTDRGLPYFNRMFYYHSLLEGNNISLAAEEAKNDTYAAPGNSYWGTDSYRVHGGSIIMED